MQGMPQGLTDLEEWALAACNPDKFKKPQDEVPEDHEFNHIPMKFRNISELDKMSRKVLIFLEARASENNGDTKILDATLMKYFDKSRSTIHRAIKKLKEFGFIDTLCAVKRDAGRVKRGSKTIFYTDRVIRCYRVVIQRRFKIMDKQEIGWRSDPRPKWNQHRIINKQTKKPIPLSWRVYEGEAGDEHGVPVIPAWKNISDLVKMNMYSWESNTFYHECNNLRYFGKHEGIVVLGYDRFYERGEGKIFKYSGAG